MTRYVRRSVCHNFLKEREVHSHAPIGGLVLHNWINFTFAHMLNVNWKEKKTFYYFFLLFPLYSERKCANVLLRLMWMCVCWQEQNLANHLSSKIKLYKIEKVCCTPKILKINEYNVFTHVFMMNKFIFIMRKHQQRQAIYIDFNYPNFE